MENGFHPHRPIFGDGSLSPSAPDHALLGNNESMNDLGAKEVEILQAHQTATIAQEERGRTKRKRASKACDACRVRKVKCESTKDPCPQCDEHGIPCLFTVPVKRRGPPNAYVEAQRAKLQLEARGLPYEGDQAALETDGLYQQSQGGAQVSLLGTTNDKGLEELASPVVLNLMFDDFFKYVYPLAPIIIESAFRRVLSDSNLHTNDFLALSASMLGCTLACLRSSESQYGGLTVEHTYQFATNRLGINYRDRMTLEIAAAIQYLALASAHEQAANATEQASAEGARAQMLSAEAVCYVESIQQTQSSSANFMQEELLKRMWHYIPCLELTSQPRQRTILTSQLYNFNNNSAPLLAKPLDLSDDSIDQLTLPGTNYQQPVAEQNDRSNDLAKSLIPGMLLTSQAYVSFTEVLATADDDSTASRKLMRLYASLRHPPNLPEQFRITEVQYGFDECFEVQHINYHVTRNFLCYLLLDRLDNLQQSMKLGQEVTDMFDTYTERKSVISETLKLLRYSRQRSLEANGSVLVRRVRQVASTLVEIIHLDSATEEEVEAARADLTSFMDVLGTLDRSEEQVVLDIEV